MSALRLLNGALAIFALLSGCTHYEPVSLHGAASLRVESEVYKGPATLSIAAQIGQNTAVLADLARALDVWRTEAKLFYPDFAYYAEVNNDFCRRYDEESFKKARTDYPDKVRECQNPPDIYHSKQRAAYKDLPAEDSYALPGANDVCVTDPVAGKTRARLDGWQDCAALGAAIASAERAVIQICFIINTPAFSRLRAGASLPFNTCEKNVYKPQWGYLLREHPLWDDINDWGIVAKQREWDAREKKEKSSENTDDSTPTMTFGAEESQTAYQLASEGWRKCLALASTKARMALKGEYGKLNPPAASATPRFGVSTGAGFDAGTYASTNPGNTGTGDKSEDLKAPKGLLEEAFTCHREPIIIALESLATTLRASAFRAADSMVRHVPKRRQFRGLIAAYAYIASEYGGQISARVNIMNKAMVDKRDVRTLPTSDFLRGADSTDFINLIEWMDAGDKSYGLTFAEYPDLPARVRMAERLNADANWEKFNEVYTSGQGEVGTAFIKNELGNWDLKAFRNDPTKLLKAYRKTTDAVLASAAKLATRAASGGGSAVAERLSASQKAVALANQLAGAKTPGGGGAVDTAAMHARVIARIEARRDALVQEKSVKDGEITVLTNKAANPATPLTEVETKQLADLKAYVQAMPGIAAISYRSILDDHALSVTMAQETLAGTEAKPAAATAK